MRKNQKKKHENIKGDENSNTVVTNITEIFVFLVKEYLTVTSQKFPLIFLSLTTSHATGGLRRYSAGHT